VATDEVGGLLGEHDRGGVDVQAARRQGLAGATVLRGIEGFGAASRIHTSRILALSEDLPLVIEIVDTADRVEAFLAAVDDMLTRGW
jgi:uncharacterized protein